MACPPTDNLVLQEFCQMMDLGNSNMISYYLEDDVVLNWYGRTIAGKQEVMGFLFRDIQITSHSVIQVENPRPLFRRDSLLNAKKRVNLQSMTQSELDEEDFDDDSGFISGAYESNSDSSICDSGSQTPCSKVVANFAKLQITTQEAPAALSDTTLLTPSTRHMRRMLSLAPRKNGLFPWGPDMKLNLIEAKGTVSFSRFETLHDTYLQWTRDCRLQLEYKCESYPQRSLSFSLLSYQDDMPCCRNLSKIFEECE